MTDSKWGFAIPASEDKKAAKRAVAKETAAPPKVRRLIDELVDAFPEGAVNVSSSGRVQRDGFSEITINVNNRPVA